MSEQETPASGEPGYGNRPDAAGSAGSGAQRRTSPGGPEPASNQGKAEPVAGEGNVSPGTGSFGSDAGGGDGVGTAQPDRGGHAGPGLGVPAGGQGASVGSGEAFRQAQRQGTSPDPIATDDEAGARATAPGGPAARRPGAEGSGDDAGVTGFAETPAPGTFETAAPAQGVRRAVYEREGTGGTDAPAEKVELPVGERRTGGSGPGSSAAAQGERPQPHVEQTQTGDAEPGEHHERPVTGTHRPAAPSGEVGPA